MNSQWEFDGSKFEMFNQAFEAPPKAGPQKNVVRFDQDLLPQHQHSRQYEKENHRPMKASHSTNHVEEGICNKERAEFSSMLNRLRERLNTDENSRLD